MGKLRLVSRKPKRIDIGDGDWIEVLSDISKRDFANLVSILPGEIGDGERVEDAKITLTIGQAMDFQKNLFEVFVKDWSVTDDDGNPVPCTVDNYLELGRESSEAIDAAVSEHFNALNPTPDESSKSPRSGKADRRK